MMNTNPQLPNMSETIKSWFLNLTFEIVERVQVGADFKIDWGKKYPDAKYPTRKKKDVQTFDIKEFVKKETVLFIAAVCAIATMFLVPPDAEYLHYIDFRVLCLLLCLMAVVAGFKGVSAFKWLTYQLLRRIRSGKTLAVTLVLLPFFSFMLVTNDVALLVFVPFTTS